MSEPVNECYPDHEQPGPGTVPAPEPAPAAGPPYADCVRCGEPTEYGVAHPGAVLCPVCAWQEAQRAACSG